MHFARHDGAERSMRQSSNGGTLWRGGGFVQCSSHRLFRKEQRGLVVHLSDKERFYINRSDEDGRTGPGSAQYDKKMIPKVLILESDHNKSGLHKNYHIFFLDSFSLTRIF